MPQPPLLRALPFGIERAVFRGFAPEERDRAQAHLMRAAIGLDPDSQLELQRIILHVAKGDLGMLAQLEQLAHADRREVIRLGSTSVPESAYRGLVMLKSSAGRAFRRMKDMQGDLGYVQYPWSAAADILTHYLASVNMLENRQDFFVRKRCDSVIEAANIVCEIRNEEALKVRSDLDRLMASIGVLGLFDGPVIRNLIRIGANGDTDAVKKLESIYLSLFQVTSLSNGWLIWGLLGQSPGLAARTLTGDSSRANKLTGTMDIHTWLGDYAAVHRSPVQAYVLSLA